MPGEPGGEDAPPRSLKRGQAHSRKGEALGRQQRPKQDGARCMAIHRGRVPRFACLWGSCSDVGSVGSVDGQGTSVAERPQPRRSLVLRRNIRRDMAEDQRLSQDTTCKGVGTGCQRRACGCQAGTERVPSARGSRERAEFQNPQIRRFLS